MTLITKRSFAVALMAAALMPVATAEAQNRSTTTMVEEWRDGDYIVRRYTTTDNSQINNDYELHFEINSSDVAAEYDHNDEVLASIDKFFTETQSMPTRHIKAIVITGYASPDGGTSFNTELAQQRAEELGTMLIEHYGLDKNTVSLSSKVEPWSATADAIEHSTLSNRKELATMVEGNASPMTIDNNLKHDKDAWAYIKSDILPPLRRTTIKVSYTEDKCEVVREYSPLPKEVIIVEEVVEEQPRHHKHHNKHHNRVMVNEWEGIIIDAGASTEGE